MAVWRCLLAVWRVSWTLWVVFEVYWCQIHWKQTCKYHFTIYWLFSQWPVFGQKNMHFRLSVRCQLGVCWVSGGCQGPSGLCLRCINAKSIGKGLVDIILNNYRIFSQLPIFGQKRLDGPDFQRGVVGHFPAFLAIFIGLYGQVMDLRTYWGGVWKKILTGPTYPPTLFLSSGAEFTF